LAAYEVPETKAQVITTKRNFFNLLLPFTPKKGTPEDLPTPLEPPHWAARNLSFLIILKLIFFNNL
jgi:hypothetical protein